MTEEIKGVIVVLRTIDDLTRTVRVVLKDTSDTEHELRIYDNTQALSQLQARQVKPEDIPQDIYGHDTYTRLSEGLKIGDYISAKVINMVIVDICKNYLTISGFSREPFGGGRVECDNCNTRVCFLDNDMCVLYTNIEPDDLFYPSEIQCHLIKCQCGFSVIRLKDRIIYQPFSIGGGIFGKFKMERTPLESLPVLDKYN